MHDPISPDSHRRGFFVVLADWIIGHRWLTFLLLVLLTVFAGIGHYDPYLILSDDIAESYQPISTTKANNRSPAKHPPANVSPMNVAGGDVIVVARCENFFTMQGANAIRDAVASLESLPQVKAVFWMDEAPMLNVFGLPEPIFPRGKATQTRFDAAKERAIEHPLVGGQLLSLDAKSMLLMVRMNWLFVNEDSECTDALRKAAERAVARHPAVAIDFAVTGEVPIQLSRASSTVANERKYQAIGFTIALVIAWILFRGITSVVIVALAPALGVFWTLGIIHFTSMDGNPFNAVIVPILLSMVGFTDGVHMMIQVRRHRSAGMTAIDAARRSIREVGIACWLTSLTTAIGFGSLALAHHEKVREFGYCCGIGVLMTFLAVITVIPLACASPLGNRVHSGYGKNFIDKNLERIVGLINWVMLHPRKISVFAILLTVLLAFVTLMLRPDERLTSNLAADSEPAAALRHVDEQFGGIETAQVSINWNDSIGENDGEIATVVQKVDEILCSEPLIGSPLSIRNFLDALPGEGDPATRMSLLELLPPGLKRNYITPEYRFARVEFRLQDLGIAAYGPVFERIGEQLIQIEKEHAEFDLQLTGGAVWRWQNLYQIVVDLAYSLGTASVIIFGVLTVMYRSIRLGLISIIPNIFPLAATGALLFCVGQHLEIVSVCAFTVCLGIAVDDTIHFLTRYREQLAAEDDQESAIRNAFVGVGTALIMTTVVLVIGFATALTSDARDHRVFAAMGMLTISTALLADLLFLPALLLQFDRSGKSGD